MSEFEDGFRAGLEAAAKVVDRPIYLQHPMKPAGVPIDHIDPSPHHAAAIRALSVPGVSAPESSDKIGCNPSSTEDDVAIWSGEHQGYWRPQGQGYTNHVEEAGIWPRGLAQRMTRTCGPEKAIELRPVVLRTTREVQVPARYWLVSFQVCRHTVIDNRIDRQYIDHINIIDKHPAIYFARMRLRLNEFWKTKPEDGRGPVPEELMRIYSAIEVPAGTLTAKLMEAL